MKEMEPAAAAMRVSRSVEFFGPTTSSPAASGFEPEFQQKSLVLSDVLQNHTMLHFFQKFLEQEYSEENLLFYLEVERFRRITTYDLLQSKALEIYSAFVNPDTAPSLINLTQEVVAQIQLRLEPLLVLEEEMVMKAAAGGNIPGSTHGRGGGGGGSGSASPLSLSSSSSEDISPGAEQAAATAVPPEREKRTSRYDTLSMRLRKSLALNDPKAACLVTTDLFDQAAIEVQGILERDSLPRFAKKSFSGSLRKPRRPVSARLSTNFSALPTFSLPPTPTKAKNENVHSGILKRRAGFFSSWKTFLYVMKAGSMFEYREDGDVAKDNPLRVIRLKNVIVRNAEEMTGKQNAFGLFATDDKRAYFFQAPTEDDKNRWMTALGASVTEFSPTQPVAMVDKPDLVKDLPILQHLEIFKECVLVIDADNVIVSANQAACKTFGYEGEELKSKPIDMLFTQPFNPDELIQDGVAHELEAKPHPDKLPFTALLSLGRLQKGHLLVTITPKLGRSASLKDIGRTNSSFF